MQLFSLPKTPHRNASAHFYKMFGFFFLGCVLALKFNLGAAFGGSLLASLLASLGIALLTLVSGIISTMLIRNFFNLAQTGRIVQYVSFALVASVVLALFGWILPGVIAVSNALFAGVSLFVFAFVPATLTGTVPWSKRSWLPIKHKIKR